jgi:hypothetical protein
VTCFVYVDNSNVWIEGQRAPSAQVGAFDPDGQLVLDPSWRYDFGELYQIACPSTEAIGRSLLIGSRPPANDSLWDLARDNGFEVELYDRNASNREKRVDTGIVTKLISDAYEHMLPHVPEATAVLVAGDGDYVPAVEQLKRLGIKVRIVFWTHGLSRDLRTMADEFIALDDYFSQLTRR